MKDFDTLRHRVEATTARLSTAQSERQEQTHSLIGMLGQLEEKYAVQEKQFAYYRDRLEPLEQSNAQLTALMENLLDLIDSGFGEGSLEPMRQASAMAAAMLAKEADAAVDAPLDPNHTTQTEPDAEEAEEIEINAEQEADPITGTETDSEISGSSALSESEPDSNEVAPVDGEPEMATLDDVDDIVPAEDVPEAVEQMEEEAPAIEDLVDLIEEESDVGEEPSLPSNEIGPAAANVSELAGEDTEPLAEEVADLELEEEALAYLDEDIEVASDAVGTDINAVAAADIVNTIAVDEEVGATVVAAENSQLLLDDAAAANEDTPVAADLEITDRFEDVSDAVLELETEEDAGAGQDDLPDVVKEAAAAYLTEGGSEDAPVELAPHSVTDQGPIMNEGEQPEAAIIDDTAAEAETIAALALAMEEETSAEDAAPPAPSDIRSLLLRVEALAKKAERMRLAQGADMKPSESSELAKDETQTDGLADQDEKKSGVAA